MTLKIGSLFSGYGGLDMAVEAVTGGRTVWVSDVCKISKDGVVGHHDPHRGACRVLAHRFPGVPNLGDITAVDWADVEPVDIITGGSPCQDLSHAGKRAGMTEGTRSNLWVQMREAIATLRPSLVIWENVRGAYSAAADSSLELDGRLLGPPTKKGRQQPNLRALGRVLGDLADLGFDAEWVGVRASDVGAAHQRLRVFLAAWPAEDTERVRRITGRHSAPGQTPGGWPPAEPGGSSGVGNDGLTLLPTPRAREMVETPQSFAARQVRLAEAGRTKGDSGMPLNVTVQLLPTPAVNDMGAGKTVEDWDAWTERMKAEHGNGNGHGKSLSIEARRLLPTPVTDPQSGNGHARDLSGEVKLLQTPSVSDASGGHLNRSGARSGELLLKGQAKAMDGARWGIYAEAVARWESLTRPAPDPTEAGPKGGRRLSARFDEWHMGLPEGWLTDVPDITWQEVVKLCGNGVVPQQATYATSLLLDRITAALSEPTPQEVSA